MPQQSMCTSMCTELASLIISLAQLFVIKTRVDLLNTIDVAPNKKLALEFCNKLQYCGSTVILDTLTILVGILLNLLQIH